MVNVAVPGGASSLGQAIVKAIMATGTHKAVIFTRSANTDTDPSGAKVASVDYTSVGVLVAALEEHEIDTVVVTSSVNAPEGRQAQMNLIEASEKSKHTKRFIPSGFGTHYDREILKYQPNRIGTVEAQERLEGSTLESTFFTNGIFLDYYTVPSIPTDLTRTSAVFFDMAGNAASIPGDGSDVIVMTHSRDIGRAVARLLDEPKWPRRSILNGDRLTCNEFVKIAEEAKGVEFKKVYQTKEMMEAGEYSTTPSLESYGPYLEMVRKALASTALLTTMGKLDLGAEGTLNERWPDFKPLTAREGVMEAWSKKEV